MQSACPVSLIRGCKDEEGVDGSYLLIAPRPPMAIHAGQSASSASNPSMIRRMTNVIGRGDNHAGDNLALIKLL